ncbi:MAG: flagellin [Rhodothalassiaceae bacterium]
MRVSTSGQQDLLIFNALNNQVSAVEQQTRISTGKIATDFEGLADRAQTTLNSRALLSRTTGFRETVTAARLELDRNDSTLTAMISTAESVREGILNAIALEDGTGLQATLEQGFSQIANLLNTQVNGEFVFAGTRTDTPPSDFTTLADLTNFVVTLGNPVADAFSNDDVFSVANVSEGVQIQTGLGAQELADTLFGAFAALDAANIPNGQIDPAVDLPALQAALAGFEAGIEQMETQLGNNGIGLSRLSILDEQLSEQEVFLEVFIGELEDADIAEAVSELQQDQVALEASFASISLLSNLSLLNFL